MRSPGVNGDMQRSSAPKRGNAPRQKGSAAFGSASLLPVTGCTLTRAEFVSILVDRGIMPEQARALFDALHSSDTDLILEALDSVTLRANTLNLRGVSALARARARR